MGEQKESRFALLFAVFGFMLIIATGVDLSYCFNHWISFNYNCNGSKKKSKNKVK